MYLIYKNLFSKIMSLEYIQKDLLLKMIVICYGLVLIQLQYIKVNDLYNVAY